MNTEKTQKLKQALSDALDVLWIEYGDGFATEKQSLIAEIRQELERIELPRLGRDRPEQLVCNYFMKDENRIKEGDTVSVNFNASQFTLSRSATVLSKQRNVGEPWVFRDDETGFIHYVSEECTVSKHILANNEI